MGDGHHGSVGGCPSGTEGKREGIGHADGVGDYVATADAAHGLALDTIIMLGNYY